MFNVLLAEDDLGWVEIMKEFLSHPPGSFNVTHAWNLEQGLAALQGDDLFDVMLLDLHLPDGDGRELLECAQELEPRLPVIVISSLDDRDTVCELYALGAKDFIGKGVFHEPFALQAHITNVIEKSEAFREAFEKSMCAACGENQAPVECEPLPITVEAVNYAHA